MILEATISFDQTHFRNCVPIFLMVWQELEFCWCLNAQRSSLGSRNETRFSRSLFTPLIYKHMTHTDTFIFISINIKEIAYQNYEPRRWKFYSLYSEQSLSLWIATHRLKAKKSVYVDSKYLIIGMWQGDCWLDKNYTIKAIESNRMSNGFQALSESLFMFKEIFFNIFILTW